MKSSNAVRQQRHRDRERNGQLSVQIDIPAEETIDLLIAARLLDPTQAYYPRREIAAAIERFLSLAHRA